MPQAVAAVVEAVVVGRLHWAVGLGQFWQAWWRGDDGDGDGDDGGCDGVSAVVRRAGAPPLGGCGDGVGDDDADDDDGGANGGCEVDEDDGGDDGGDDGVDDGVDDECAGDGGRGCDATCARSTGLAHAQHTRHASHPVVSRAWRSGGREIGRVAYAMCARRRRDHDHERSTPKGNLCRQHAGQEQ